MSNKQTISHNQAFAYLFWKYFKADFKINWFVLPSFLFWAGILMLVPLMTQQINMSLLEPAQRTTTGFFLTRFWGLNTFELVGLACGLLFLNVFNSFYFNWWGNLFAKKIETNLRNEILNKLVRQDISYYSDKKIGELLTNVIADSQIVGNQAVNVPMSLFGAIIQLIAGLIMTFILDWRIASVGFSIFIVLITLFIIFYILVTNRYEKIRAANEVANGNVIDRIISIRLIKASGTEAYETQYFKDKHVDFYQKNLPLAKFIGLLSCCVFMGDFIILFTTPIFAYVFYANAADGQQFTNFFNLVFPSYTISQTLLTTPIITMYMVAGGFALGGVSSARILRTLNAESILDPHYHQTGQPLTHFNGQIKFVNVAFRYPEKPRQLILPAFNFTFEQGKSYAFVGETGSGKSTIAKLLLRFYDPSDGDILINGTDNLKALNLASYLDYVGYVEQEPQIIFGNIFDNVKYGRFTATDEQVIAACKQAELHALIMSWPDQYHTILGERGFMLSGGQKQRLVIARMFLKNPSLLILDEATSALDNIVEKEIQIKLNELMQGRTSVTIAHKLSTIKNCDHIVVLGGAGAGIVQQGTFQSLINTPGHFKNLYDAGLMGK